jgi:hypothetical protein
MKSVHLMNLVLWLLVCVGSSSAQHEYLSNWPEVILHRR